MHSASCLSIWLGLELIVDDVIQNDEEELTDVMQLWAAPIGEVKDKLSISTPR